MTIIEITSIVTLVVLVATVIVAAIYAYFTWGLWKTSIGQAKQNVLPLPVIYVRGNGVSGSRTKIFRIRNIGYGAALNIEIEPFKLNVTGNKGNRKPSKKFEYTLKMGDPNILIKDEERSLSSRTYLNGKEFSAGDDLLFPHLHPDFALKTFPLRINYQDIKGNFYSIKIAFGKGRLNVIEFPKI